MNDVSKFSRFRHRIEPIAVSTAIIALIVSGGLSYRSALRLRDHHRWVAHTQEVLYAVESFQASLVEAEAGGRGFLLTGDDRFLKTYDKGRSAVMGELDAVQTLTQDNPLQQSRIPAIREAAAARLSELASTVQQRQAADLPPSEVADVVNDGKQMMDRTRRLVKEFQDEERALLADRESDAEQIGRSVLTTIVLSTLAGLGLVAGVLYLIARGRRRTQQAASEIASERSRLLKTLVGIRDGVVSTDRDGRIDYANPTAEKLLGTSFAKLSGQNADAIIRLLDPTTRAPLESPVQTRMSSDAADESLDEAILVDANDSETPVEASVAVLKSNRNESNGAVVVLRDIAQRKRLEEVEEKQRMSDRQLAAFVEQVSDYAIFMISPDMKAATWNAGVEQVLGYTEDEFIGVDILEAIFLPESIADGSAQREFDIAKDRGEANDDRWMRNHRGERFWASGITTGVFDDDGKLLGYNKVLRNLTERKVAEEELKILAAELSESDRNKTMFLATLAHELRNPLSPIKNTVQVLSRNETNEETQELLTVAQGQVEQMTRLIEDLMDVSRISRGKVELRREFVSLTAVVESAIEASRPLIENNGQTLEINISDDPITLNADPARIAQVTSNLLNNASKYSNPGDRIWLTVDSDDESAKITIRDEGIGIAPDEIDDVFKMFTQVAESVERGSSGLGIGLTLVSNFVDMHGGTVTVTSEGKGKGSCFNVTLPLADPSAVADAREPEVATSTPIRQFNILVVDDTRAITFVMERLLKELGQEVRTAENGLTAIEVLTNFQPDLIFSDISMPGMNGYELAKHIRGNEASKHMRMIAMTGFGQPTDRTRAIDAGFDDHVVKPVDYSVIEDVLRRFSTETADD